MSLGNGIDGRRGDADFAAELRHPQLVIDDRVGRPRVVVEDALGIAAVHAEDAEIAKLLSAEEPMHAASFRSAEMATTAARPGLAASPPVARRNPESDIARRRDNRRSAPTAVARP